MKNKINQTFVDKCLLQLETQVFTKIYNFEKEYQCQKMYKVLCILYFLQIPLYYYKFI